MEITASNIQLSSAHVYQAKQTVTESLRLRVTAQGGDHRGHQVDRWDRGGSSEDRDLQKLTKLLKRLFNSTDDAEAAKLEDRINALEKRIQARASGGDDQPADPAAGGLHFDLRYRRTEKYQEVEATSFRASGSVTTADGRQIDFSQALDLARAYARTETISIRASGTIDPSAPTPSTPSDPAAATGTTSPAATPAAAPAPTARQGLAIGNAALGYDANGDGAIDPTSELLGANGDGFGDLAKLDSDGNGFVDSGDAAFAKLGLVASSPNGTTTTSLADSGVGALYTGSVATPYTFTDANNQAVGQLARTGIYLNENGTTGLLKQVDILA